jgi:transposase-like protein
MKPRKSSLEVKGQIKRYISQGLRQPEIAKLLGMSRQRLFYWIKRMREEE